MNDEAINFITNYEKDGEVCSTALLMRKFKISVNETYKLRLEAREKEFSEKPYRMFLRIFVISLNRRTGMRIPFHQDLKSGG